MKKPLFLKKINEGVYYFNKINPYVDRKIIDFIIQDSEKNQFKRSRICTHQNSKSKLHEMFISIQRDSYIRPHKHLKKDESYFLLKGNLDIIIFNHNGEIKEIICLTDRGKNKKIYYKLLKNTMHTIVIKSKYVVIQEVALGPFNKNNDVFANFSPNEIEKGKIILYKKMLNKKIKKFKLINVKN